MKGPSPGRFGGEALSVLLIEAVMVFRVGL